AERHRRIYVVDAEPLRRAHRVPDGAREESAARPGGTAAIGGAGDAETDPDRPAARAADGRLARVGLGAGRAWRVARYGAALGGLGLTFDHFTLSGRFGDTHSIELSAIAICVATYLTLWVWLHYPSKRLGTAAFLVVNVAIIVSLWTTTAHLASAGINWVPF